MVNFSEYSLLTNSDLGANFTSKEITQQPELWIKTFDIVKMHKKNLEIFLDRAYEHPNLNIIATGAGSSAFIGEIIKGCFQRNTGKITRAIATTDIISHPQDYFAKDGATLCISFARSGDSPESIAAYNLATEMCPTIFHLIITCNPEGELAQHGSDPSTYVFLLPQESNDQGLAMTGSFTCMLLAGLLVAKLNDLPEMHVIVNNLAQYGRKIISRYASILRNIADLDFERVVFLGSGPQKGVAEESHLKVQELTAGRIICKFDSFLGFRHGPKVIINDTTIVFYLFSNNFLAHQYEKDLVYAINQNQRPMYQIGIFENDHHELILDTSIDFSNEESIPEEFLGVCSVLPAQMLGLFKSLQLGLKPDNPAEDGTITRVVQGVTIYDLPGHE